MQPKRTRHPAIRASMAKLRPALTKLARDIHADPELGFMEQRACRRQVALLKKWGFDVTAPFAGLATAFKATSGHGAPVLCFMSEYDALKELGHGCGHNLIAASALGAGRALAEVLRAEKIPGTVVVMGTPAEETLGGKVNMIAAGAMKGIDAAMMAHPSWQTTPDTGSTAVDRYDVTFQGKAAHAAASPELGRNALDAVLLLFQGINAWRQQLPETSRVHGIITSGGVAPNIIPDHASAFFYLRSTDDAVLATMKKRFADIVKGAALMTGTRASLKQPSVPYRACRPNRPLNEVYVDMARQLGLKPVIPEQPGRGSTDFGDVSQIVPGVHVYFGISKGKIAAHSTEMRDAAASAYGIAQMLRVAEAMANVGYLFFSDQPYRREVAADYASLATPPSSTCAKKQ